MIGKLASSSLASGKNNVAFLSFFIRGDLEQCLDLLISTSRLPEAAFFARAYMPSKLPQVSCNLIGSKVDFWPPARAEPLAQQNTGPLAGAGPLVSRYRRPNLW